MFELLQLYETAKHEKNKVLRFFYLNHVRRSLKNKYFNKFKFNILSNMISLDENLLAEFAQFYGCMNYIKRGGDPYMISISESADLIYVRYQQYLLKYKLLENTCDIDIGNSDLNKSILIHPADKETFYSGLFAVIILMAIYNYCVAYIYGENSKLYINHKSWAGKIESMFI